MSGDRLYFEEPDDELNDNEYPDDDFEDDFDDGPAETLPCSECGAEIYEDAVRCPACGAYVNHDTRPWTGRPAWWIVLGLLGLAATVLALAGLM